MTGTINKTGFLIIGLIIGLSGSAGADKITYYFNAYDAGKSWGTAPENMADGIETNYASTKKNKDVELLTGNTCPGTDMGAIIKVEIRAYGYYTTDDNAELRPVFGGTANGDDHLNALPASAGWGQYFDITADTNAPATWTGSDVQSLDCDVKYYKTGRPDRVYVGKVEIRVTFSTAVSVDCTNGAEKNEFGEAENVCANGTADSDGADIRVCDNKTWTGGESLSGCTLANSVSGGDFGMVNLGAYAPGSYDIVLDNDKNGYYNSTKDAVDGADVNPGFIITPLPETIVLFLSGLFILFLFFSNNNK